MDSISEEYCVDQAATGSAKSEPVVRGEIFAFLGPNGAGKTTTVEILEGFRLRTEGQVSPLTAVQAFATGPGSPPAR
jgi:ABC-2 type transport system ATP-binding protein